MHRFTNFVKALLRKPHKPLPPPPAQPPLVPPANRQLPDRPADEATRPSLRIKDPEVLELYKALDQAG